MFMLRILKELPADIELSHIRWAEYSDIMQEWVKGRDEMLIFSWQDHTKHLTEEYKTLIAAGQKPEHWIQYFHLLGDPTMLPDTPRLTWMRNI
jgi:hypothetical protein